eukprot:scaffold20169_cov21-Tisochrysis_lutea.AAC.3
MSTGLGDVWHGPIKGDDFLLCVWPRVLFCAPIGASKSLLMLAGCTVSRLVARPLAFPFVGGSPCLGGVSGGKTMCF